jgi:hypothetical protein
VEVDVSAVVCDYDGQPVIDDVTKEPVTFRSLWSHALNRRQEGEALSVSEADRIYALCSKLYASSKVRLDVVQRKLIIDRTALFFSPLIVGRSRDLLDPDSRASLETDEDPVAPSGATGP